MFLKFKAQALNYKCVVLCVTVCFVDFLSAFAWFLLQSGTNKKFSPFSSFVHFSRYSKILSSCALIEMMFSQIHVISLIARLILVDKICDCAEWIPLQPKGSSKANNLGYSVAIEDTIIVVGDLGSGATYVFEQDSINGNWIQTANLFALQDTNDNSDDDYLGTSVDVSTALGKDKVIIGARGGESSFVFEKNVKTGIWQKVSKLVSNSSVGDAKCGNSVAIYGDYAITGCSSLSGGSRIEVFKDININNSNEWINIQTLFEVGNVDYGYYVSMYDRYLIVGTRSGTSKTYIYERREITEDWHLMNEMTLLSNISGVDTCKDFAIVGASNSGMGLNLHTVLYFVFARFIIVSRLRSDRCFFCWV